MRANDLKFEQKQTRTLGGFDVTVLDVDRRDIEEANLKPTTLATLQQAKQKLEQQRAAEIAAWEQDFRANTTKMAGQQLRKRFEPVPVAQPGERHSALKARLNNLNQAIQKQGYLDALSVRAEKMGLMNDPGLQADVDTRLLSRNGPKDDYATLNQHLDIVIKRVKDRIAQKKAAYAKPSRDRMVKEFAPPDSNGGSGEGERSRRLRQLLNIAIKVGKEKNVDELGMIHAMNMIAGDDFYSMAVESLLPDITGNERMFVLETAYKTIKQGLAEQWSQKYKSSINCSHPKGFSQRAHCAGKKKHNESTEMEMVCEDCGMCATHGDHSQQSLGEACWKGYHKEGMKTMFGKRYPNCVKNKNESLEIYIKRGECPGCGERMVAESQLNEKQDACYHKVKSRYKVWPSAYASGALVQCRKKGAANWGNSNESITQEEYDQLDENLKKWFSDKWVRFGPDGKIKGDCARGDDSEGKPKCLPQSKAHSLGKKGRASAAARKRRQDPNAERSGKAINVVTNKKSNERVLEAIKLNAPQRKIPRDELQGYADRVKTGTKTKRDKFAPIIHGSNIKAIVKDEDNTEWDLDDLAKQITTRPRAILGTNAKMEKSATEGEIVYDLTLPALSGIVVDEETGDFVEITTCPGAGACQLFCYARKGGYVMFPASSMSAAQALNFLVNDPEGYSARVNQEIQSVKKKADKHSIQLVVRWHDAGDFFSKEYLDLAFEVARANPDVEFYAYTKIADVATANKPNNFIINFSSGSKRGEEKKVEFHKSAGNVVKQGVTIPKDMFFDLIARDGTKLNKDAKGRTQFKDHDALNEFKRRIAVKYNVNPATIITYDQMLATPVGTEPKWNVIVQPGAGDRAANRKDVIDSYLMFH